VLSGARPPEGLTIRIFTITGRRIQEITVPPTDLRVGFNRIWWDGRDRDGDEIANGYYFYKIQVEGEGKVETAIEKMAKVR
jgi:flagellar hook assembly protein FlgD